MSGEEWDAFLALCLLLIALFYLFFILIQFLWEDNDLGIQTPLPILFPIILSPESPFPEPMNQNFLPLQSPPPSSPLLPFS